MRIYFISIGAIILLAKCKPKHIPIRAQPQIIHIDSTDYTMAGNVDGYITGISFLPIATSENNVIGNINKVERLKDKWVILDQMDNGTIWIIDDSGRIVKSIPNIRAQKINDIAVDKDFIEVYYKVLKKLDIFDESGKLVRTESMGRDLLADKFVPLRDDTYAFWSGTTLNKDGQYRVLIYNDHNNFHSGFLSFDPDIANNMHLFNNTPFHRFGAEDIVVTYPLCDTIFALRNYDDGELDCYPRYAFSFTKRPLPKGFINDPTVSDYMMTANEHNYAYFGGKYMEFDSSLIVSNVANVGLTYYCIWDKRTRKLCTNAYGLRHKKLDLDIPMYNMGQVDAGRAVGFYYPYQLIEWADAHRVDVRNDMQQALLNVCNKLQQMDNPVLVQISFK